MYIRGFDGLRAFAIVLVVLMHHTVWGAQAQIGFAGVWLFFLLSGFLITGQLRTACAKAVQGGSSVGHELVVFWLKRAFRIFPAYYMLIVLVTPFYLLTCRDVAGLPWYTSYLSNFYFQLHPQEFLTTFAHFWSLAVEEQFYLLFAPLLLLIPYRRATVACATIIVVSLLQRFGLAAWQAPAYAIYIDSLVNFGLLASGGILYLHRDRVAVGVRLLRLDHAAVGVAAAMLLVGLVPLAKVLAASSPARLQMIYVVAAAVAALLVTNVYLNQHGRLTAVLEWSPVTFVGRISYGMYLYNDYVKTDLPQRILRMVWEATGGGRPAPAWVNDVLADQGLSSRVAEVVGVLTCFGVLLGVAKLSWTLVEHPSLRLRTRVLSVWGERSAVRAKAKNGVGASATSA